jgi:hypothetical protein
MRESRLAPVRGDPTTGTITPNPVAELSEARFWDQWLGMLSARGATPGCPWTEETGDR